jgi:methylmalonyl-CoA mutase C-terminal domain/subunit
MHSHGTTQQPTRLRVLVAKLGLDGHDRGIKIVARALRDAGHEVIYLGRRQSVRAVVRTALAEDVDVLGVSDLSGTHLAVMRELMDALRAAGADDTPVVLGGTVLRRDVPALLDLGVAAVFPVGTPLQDIRDYFAQIAARKAPAAALEAEGSS